MDIVAGAFQEYIFQRSSGRKIWHLGNDMFDYSHTKKFVLFASMKALQK